MSISQRDRIVGCILGGAIGDAIGLPFEGDVPQSNPELNGQRISDDTQLTLATCEAIIENNGNVDPSTIASRFVAWHRDRRIDGLGASSSKALSELIAGGHWALVGRKGEYAAGNGAAMRIAPLSFCLDPHQPEHRQVIRDVSRITHHSEEAFIGALAVAIAIRAAWDGSWNGETNLFPLIAASIPDSKLRDRFLDMTEIRGDISVAEIAARFGSSGYVVESVPLSVYAARQVLILGFEEMMRELICVGGDTDTIASISGQVAGTLLGAKRLPEHLVMQLNESVFIETVADKFAETISAGKVR